MRLLPRQRALGMALPLLLLLAVAVNAQDSESASSAAPSTQEATTTQQTKTTDAKTTDAKTTQAKSTTAATSTASKISIGDISSDSSTDTSSVTDAPTAAASLSSFELTDSFPTIAGVGVPTQVVPNTNKAPFMQKSNLPEGTVFICVGAILGFLGMSVLAWRGAVAWSLHRSVQRASNAHNEKGPGMLSKPGNTKSVYGAGTLGSSTVSLDRLSQIPGKPVGGRLKSSHGNAPTPIGANPTAARNSNLFFSPTAGAGNHSNPAALGLGGQNRSSAFLPAGYYSSPSAASPASGAGATHVGAPSTLSQLNPLNTAARAGYTRNFGPSPPGSPRLPPSRKSGEDLRRYDATPSSFATAGVRSSTTTPLYAHSSTSNLNLHVPGGGTAGQRAPSANLEDLFEHHGNGMNRY